MVERIAIYMIGRMEEANLIHEDMTERYFYVLTCRLEKYITIGAVLLISIFAQRLLQTLCFLLFFLELRKRTGGYHLQEFYHCFLATIALYVLILNLCTILAKQPQWLFGMLLPAMLWIAITGTVNHPNMHMNTEELAMSKYAARVILLLEGSIICVCALLGADMNYISYMAMAVILCAVLLCISKILKQEVKNDEEG